MNWLRLYHEVISDPKWPAVARRAQTNQGTVVSVWVALLIYASQQDERGSVDGFCATDCDALYGYDDGTCQRVIDALKERGVIQDGKLAAWDKRQPKRERETDETSTERVRKYRQARAVTSCNANETALKHHETPCNANENHETPPDKDKIKIREDKDYYDAREKGGVGEKETQPPAAEAAASLSTPSGSKAQPQEPEPNELILSADPAKPPAPSKPQPVSAQAIADLWNRMMPERGFARVTRVTNQRAAHIRARQREFKTRGAETLDFWRKVFVVTYRSDLLNGTRGRTGKDGRRWQADFDFCIESEEKLTRLIEGKYDNNDSGGYEWVDYQSPPQRLDKAG